MDRELTVTSVTPPRSTITRVSWDISAPPRSPSRSVWRRRPKLRQELRCARQSHWSSFASVPGKVAKVLVAAACALGLQRFGGSDVCPALWASSTKRHCARWSTLRSCSIGSTAGRRTFGSKAIAPPSARKPRGVKAGRADRVDGCCDPGAEQPLGIRKARISPHVAVGVVGPERGISLEAALRPAQVPPSRRCA